jgi:predicted Zn-dependent peptidase
MPSEQVSIYLGGLLPGAAYPEWPALNVTRGILSNRLFASLRERQGLAYSVGVGAEVDRDFGWFYAVIGTAGENYDQAVRGILLEFDKLQYDGPVAGEVSAVRNEIVGSMIRAWMPRVNQAFYMAEGEYLGRSIGYQTDYVRRLNGVTADDVRRSMARYFRLDGRVQASAGTRP